MNIESTCKYFSKIWAVYQKFESDIILIKMMIIITRTLQWHFYLMNFLAISAGEGN